ncbi:MAG: hypothetical protein QM595_14095 [Nocardioides sp.]
MQVISCSLAELRDLLVGEANSLPLPLDYFLDLMHRQVREVAVVAPPVLGEAVEIFIRSAVACCGHVAESGATTATLQTAFEVVRVPPGAVSGDASAGEDVLGALPEHLIDQRFVCSRVDHPFEQDLAFVVRVGQHPVDLGAVERFPDDLPCGAALEASLLQLVS